MPRFHLTEEYCVACPFHESQTVAPARPCPAYCIDTELYGAIDYLLEQVPVLVEHEQNQNMRIRLTKHQRIRVTQ